MLRAGGGAGVAQQLHRQAGEHLRHGHGLEVGRAAAAQRVGAGDHHVQGLLGEGGHALAVVFPGDETGDLPVREGDVLGEDVRDAADGEEHGRAGDDVEVRDDEGWGGHGDGALVPVDDDGADIGGEAVGGGEGGDGDEGLAELEGGVAGEVHECAAADGDDDVGVVELGDDGLDEALFGVEALGFKDDLLVGADVDHAGKVVGVGVV